MQTHTPTVMGRNDRPRSHWDTFFTHEQTLTADYYINNILEKEVKPVLHSKNVNEATDKRKLFSSNRHITFVQDGAPAHAAKATKHGAKKTAKFYRENMMAPKFPRYQPCGESLEHNG